MPLCGPTSRWLPAPRGAWFGLYQPLLVAPSCRRGECVDLVANSPSAQANPAAFLAPESAAGVFPASPIEVMTSLSLWPSVSKSPCEVLERSGNCLRTDLGPFRQSSSCLSCRANPLRRTGLVSMTLPAKFPGRLPVSQSQPMPSSRCFRVDPAPR